MGVGVNVGASGWVHGWVDGRLCLSDSSCLSACDFACVGFVQLWIRLSYLIQDSKNVGRETAVSSGIANHPYTYTHALAHSNAQTDYNAQTSKHARTNTDTDTHN